MLEIALHILDIIQNSIHAESTEIELQIIEDPKNNLFAFSVKDNGKGMTEEFVKQLKNPFHTTRTTRKVGLGIPLLVDACQQSKGDVEIKSKIGKGTFLKAWMNYNHIDRAPLGDMPSTIVSILLSLKDQCFVYIHRYANREFSLDTRELKEILGEVSLQDAVVLQWLRNYVEENLTEIRQRS